MTDVDQPTKQKAPVWFRLLNLTFLLPCVLWPLVFFATIFFFDDPKSFFLTALLFIAVNAYPLYLIGILLLNARLFRRNRIIATALPVLFSSAFIAAAFHFIGGPDTLRQLSTQLNSRPDLSSIQGELCCGFTKDSTNIYYRDTLLPSADPSTFKIIDFHWAKDTNAVYFNGTPIPTIDPRTFRYLDFHYAVDSTHVYYDDQVIEGADVLTFEHIEGTQDGKDANSCYRYGEKVDCNVLLTEED